MTISAGGCARLLLCWAPLAGPCGAAAAAETAGAVAVGPTAAECAVWERERSFSRTVERHDAAAFAAHLHPGAVFIAGDGRTVRGREAVAGAWAALIAGTAGVLYWYPRTVVIGGDPDVALSAGPYWQRNPDPQAAQPWLLGQFISTWVRVDGEWYVLFDGGGGNVPRPADETEITTLRAGLPESCRPAGQ